MGNQASMNSSTQGATGSADVDGTRQEERLCSMSSTTSESRKRKWETIDFPVDEQQPQEDEERDEVVPRKRRRTFVPANVLKSARNYFHGDVWMAKALLWLWENTSQERIENEMAWFLTNLYRILDKVQNKDLTILRRGWKLLLLHCRTCVDATEKEASNDIELVLFTMEQNPNILRMQLLGFRALRILIVDDETRHDQWDCLLEAGGIPIFLKILDNFPTNVIVQGLGLTFLAMMVREQDDKGRENTVDLGAVQSIMTAMTHFPEDPYLLHTGCYALHQIGFNDVTKAGIIEYGGSLILAKALLRYHEEDECLVDLALSTLVQINDETTQRDRNFAPLFIICMDKWSTNTNIQCRALLLLMRCFTNDHPVPLDHSIELFIRAMRCNPDCASLQFFGCVALRGIVTQFHRGQPHRVMDNFARFGGIEQALRAMDMHPTEVGLQRMTQMLLMDVGDHYMDLLNTANRPPNAEQEGFSAFGGGDLPLWLIFAHARWQAEHATTDDGEERRPDRERDFDFATIGMMM